MLALTVPSGRQLPSKHCAVALTTIDVKMSSKEVGATCRWAVLFLRKAAACAWPSIQPESNQYRGMGGGLRAIHVQGRVAKWRLACRLGCPPSCGGSSMWWATTRTPTWRLTRTSGRLIRTCAAWRPTTSASGTMCDPALLSQCLLSRLKLVLEIRRSDVRAKTMPPLTWTLLSMPVLH